MVAVLKVLGCHLSQLIDSSGNCLAGAGLEGKGLED